MQLKITRYLKHHNYDLKLQTPFMHSSIYPFSRQSLSLCCLSGPELDGQTCSCEAGAIHPFRAMMWGFWINSGEGGTVY